MKILSQLKQALRMSFVFLFLCGIAYPLLLTGVSQVIFPYQANGSLIEVEGKVLGSVLVGQNFTDRRFMQGRPSSIAYNTYTETQTKDFAGPTSGSSNYSPSSPALRERVEADKKAFLAAHPDVSATALPSDLFTASASGLDPDLSPAAAAVQIPELAAQTGLSEEVLGEIVAENTTHKFLGIFGEECVNVLGVNLSIAQMLEAAA